MRIAYVSADRGIPVFGAKGASVHIQEMMRAFAATGHEVRCVASRRGSGENRGLRVEEMTPASPGNDREAKERAAMEQANSIERRLCDLHREWPFDMIYERYSLWSAAGCRAGARLGLPVVVEVNAPLVLEQSEFRELVCTREARDIEAEVLASADVLAAVSRQVADYLLRKNTNPARVHVVGNAVDTGLFSPEVAPATLPTIPDDAFVVGFTGSLKLWHGIDTLMEAFRCLHAARPQAHLLVLGDGPMRGWIEGFAAGANLTQALTMPGWVEHSALPSLIARMDVATAPYPQADEHYFSPLKLYEYLAMGRPVVASDIGQTAELLSGSPAAILTPPGDTAALTEALISLADAPGRLAGMAAASALEGRRHDWKENALRVIALGQAQRQAA